MPTYDLVCRSCGHRFERFMMRLLRDEDKVCPACGSHDVGTGVGGGYAAPKAGERPSSSCGGTSGFG